MEVERNIASELLRVVCEDLGVKVFLIDNCNLFIYWELGQQYRKYWLENIYTTKHTKDFIFNGVVVESNESIELTWDTSIP